MEKEKFCIDMPDEMTIQNEINIILDKGLKHKKSFFSYMRKMYKQLGLKVIFHDFVEIVFTLLIFLSLFLVIKFNEGAIDYEEVKKIYGLIMIASPILYLILSLISLIKIKENRTYEIEMTCKYNLYQLSAFRMFVFSVICILFNVSIIFNIVCKFGSINFLRATMISITSLFLFSTMFLYLIIKIRSKITKYLAIVGWIAINLLLYIFNNKLYTNILTALPIGVYFIVTVICIYFYIKKLRELIKFTTIKGVM